MIKTLKVIIKRYGAEKIMARLMEQIRLLSYDNAMRDEVAAIVNQYEADTEYIYSLCEYTNLITYTSENPHLSDEPWEDEVMKKGLENHGKKKKRKLTKASVYMFPTEGGSGN